MSTFFNSVHITNFKSLKDVTLSDCKRINLLIGKPNVGKSNIIEAIGLFSLPYYEYNKSKKLTQFVRLENLAELFFDGNTEEEISIRSNDNRHCIIRYRKPIEFIPENHLFIELDVNKSASSAYNTLLGSYSRNIIVDTKLNIIVPFDANQPASRYALKIKNYKFPQNFLSKKQKIGHSCLIPPFGVNLPNVIQENNQLQKELSSVFSEYRLKLAIDIGSQELRIQKDIKEGLVFSLPFSSMADTLQRIIFFKAAIVSNEDSIILFEEPEAHCFPPYITHIAKEIIDSETNQFFITTHSPYILDTFLEYDRDDLAIFMADFKDGQTVIKRLTDAELNDVYEYGLDLFFNAELFTDEI